MTRDTVPVASNLLETTFMGVSVRRLGQSFALPLAPALVLYILPVAPMLVTTAMFVAGLLLGAIIYQQTPPGQEPLPWALARIRYRTQPIVYTWQAPDVGDHGLATGPTQDEWLTRAVAPTHGGNDAHAEAAENTQPVDRLATGDTADGDTTDGDTSDGPRPEVH